MFIPLALMLVGWQSRPPVDAQPLLGADEIMRRMAAHRPRPKETDKFARLRAESAALRAKPAGLSPEQAAGGWLSLMRDWEAVSSKNPPADPSVSDQWAEIMMAALPEPRTWPLIRTRLAKLPTNAKRSAAIALFDDLLGRDAEVLRYLESRRNPDADPLKEDQSSTDRGISQAEQPIALRAGNLDLLAKIYIRRVRADTFYFWEGLPDIVRQFGRERAGPIIRQMLEESQMSLGNFDGVETQNLARSIVLSDLAGMKAPHWELARGLGDFPFVAAQVARFGEDTFKNHGFAEGADLIYALGLAKKGQIDHAEGVLSSASGGYRDLATFVNGDWDEKSWFALVSELLDRKPTDALWPLYVDLGRSLGRIDEVFKRLDGLLSTQGLEPDTRATYLARKASLDLASGRIREAIAEYEECVRLQPREHAETLLSVAEVVGDREALDFVARTAKTMGTAGSRLGLFDAYVGQDRISEAQAAVLAAAQDVHNVNLSAEGQGRLLDAYPDTGIELAELYYEENEPSEILTLLHEYPSWGADDLLGVIDHRRGDDYYASGRRGESLGFYAAWALAKSGQKPLAVRVLHSLIAFDGGSDATFELLNQLEGARAVPLYDKLIKAAPFESRPLMWKGELLFRIGKLKDAERSVRAAIALDPADAGAAHGRGRVAYDILARILAAEGRNAEAEDCRQVLKAAHMAEQGDKEWSVGLSSQAAEHYREALEANPQDCYAQGRLSQVLQGLGKHGEALAAYEQALKLLPSSQGPAGGVDLFEARTFPLAERTFRNEGRRKLARETLANLKRSHPRNPGILFAIGQFDSQVGDDKGALASYEEAVKVDPRFLRGWEGIAELAPKGVATKKQIEEAVLSLIGLAPLSGLNYRSYRALEAFGDKSALWLAYRKAAVSIPQLPKPPLYPLEASKRSLAAGTRPIDLRRVSDSYEGPGAFLGSLGELRALFP